ncbi:cytochrome b/b6 domain-containing protein [Caballeronia sp. SL2Y3]|uniref:cytochrome b/b6 domain-containing protein n=1 Tax=Caballeronia sp. SL2Y3 TaxID=2878151 RepID=UPI00351CDBCF
MRSVLDHQTARQYVQERTLRTVQPLWLRITHWVNAFAILVMVTSGWQIYNASPIFKALTFSPAITLGGWLGGALQWHFAAMWLLVANFIVYLAMNVATGRLRRRMFPLSIKSVFSDAFAALRGKLGHDDLTHYNAVQKFAYLAVIVDIVVIILSGLVVWKSVQFPWLRTLLGGYDNARVVHFFGMSFLVAFVVLHVAMVALVPRSLVLMIKGR